MLINPSYIPFEGGRFALGAASVDPLPPGCLERGNAAALLTQTPAFHAERAILSRAGLSPPHAPQVC